VACGERMSNPDELVELFRPRGLGSPSKGRLTCVGPAKWLPEQRLPQPMSHERQVIRHDLLGGIIHEYGTAARADRSLTVPGGRQKPAAPRAQFAGRNSTSGRQPLRPSLLPTGPVCPRLRARQGGHRVSGPVRRSAPVVSESESKGRRRRGGITRTLLRTRR
jgi:hypothetical protein